MQSRDKNPLSVAIRDNDIETVELLLKDKHILAGHRDFYLAFDDAEKISRETLALLDTYHALPSNISMSTLKFHLYYRGNPNISPSEFLDKPDLNLERCPYFVSPMDMFAHKGDVNAVKWLMRKHVQQRQIYLFNNTLGPYGIHLLDIEESKEKFRNHLSMNPEILDKSFINKCKIAVLFLRHPTNDLKQEIEKESSMQHEHDTTMSLFPFFAWAAANNRADLLELEYFKILLNVYPDARKEALQIAALFDARDFIRKLIPSLDHDTLRAILRVVVASHNQPLLEDMTEALNLVGASLKVVSYIHLEKGACFTSADSPLFWSIRTKNLEAVNYLLENGINPNLNQDFLFKDSYLHLAIRGKNLPIVNTLLAHGANPNHQDSSKTTPLHTACEREQWDIAELLIRHKASTLNLDDNNKSPLDYIKDENIKHRLTALQEENTNSQLKIDKEPKSQFKLFDHKEVFSSTIKDKEAKKLRLTY